MIEPRGASVSIETNVWTDLVLAGFLHAKKDGTGFSAKERQKYAVTQP